MKKIFVTSSLCMAVMLAMTGGVAEAATSVYTSPANISGTPGSTVTVEVVFHRDAGDPADAFSGALEYSNDLVTVSNSTPVHAGAVCIANNALPAPNDDKGRVAIVAASLTDGSTVMCRFDFTIDAAAPVGTTPLMAINPDFGGGDGTETFASPSVIVTTGDVVVSFTPASGGTVAFGGGAPGDTSNGSIAVGNTGTIGSGTVNNCVISGADAGAFSVTGGDPTTAPPGGNITLEATLGAAALTATLTCDVADSGGASTATWTLTAPAGTTLAAPTLGATPASGAAITLPTSTGTPVSSPIAIAPTAAGDTGGPAATLACSATAGFTVAPASLTFAAGSAVGQNVMVGCTPDTADAAGSVSCTGSDASGAITWSWPVTCPAAVDAPPAPTFIPATSLWSKLALFGVFAALGMLVLGLRRNH